MSVNNLTTSSQLKAFLLANTTSNGFQVTKDANKTPKTASSDDVCVVVKVNNGYCFDTEYIKLIAQGIMPCGVYKEALPNVCSFLLSDWNQIIKNGEAEKLVIKSQNIEAPKQSKQLQNTISIKELTDKIISENRLPTLAESELLESYEGVGGLAKEGIRGLGILSEFYTPDVLVQKMWGLAYKYGFQANGKVLEPSCGVGRFFKYHNPALIDAYEIDPTAYNIAKLLYPKANITLGSFETKFFRGNFHIPNIEGDYDLVIGNPPYEEYKSQYSPKEKQHTGAFTFDQYFIVRGLNMLKSGGLMVFIIPSTFIRNDHKYNVLKNNILGKAAFLDAYRLPNGVFPNTNVGTDIVVFKKY